MSDGTIDDGVAGGGQTDAGLPSAPRSLPDTGLGEQVLIELLAKALYLRGNLKLIELSQQLRLPAGLLDELLGFMRGERIVELRRRGSAEGDAEYGLTEQGRARAADFLRKCRYAGPAPVTLADYAEKVGRQSISDMIVTWRDVEEAYRNLVVNEGLRDLVGAAMNSGRPLFLYGPAGSGKTYLAESLMRLLHGAIAIPHALLVDGEIIQVFDPMLHRRIAAHGAESRLDSRKRPDGRWVLCERPVVMSGGELNLEMLNLRFDQTAGFYHAPVHVKANNGLYVVDDLGRQQIRPEQLMNRWIVPMEYHRDHLSLHTGSSFEIPFDVKLVFSSNLGLTDLADEAFLRRLGYKIFVGPMKEADYRQVFRMACTEFGMAFEGAAFDLALDHLLLLHRRHGRGTMACYPRDLVGRIQDFSRYREIPAALTPALIDWAWNAYCGNESMSTGLDAPPDAQSPPAQTS